MIDVVEQSLIARTGFDPRIIHSPAKMTPVESAVNQVKANYYSSIRRFTGGQTVRDWLNGQCFQDQHDFGSEVLNRIINGEPLP